MNKIITDKEVTDYFKQHWDTDLTPSTETFEEIREEIYFNELQENSEVYKKLEELEEESISFGRTSSSIYVLLLIKIYSNSE